VRAAAALLIVAGLLLLLGAQAPWVICSSDPCPPGVDDTLALQVIWTRDGLAVGWGFVTGALGLVVLGAAARLGRVRRAVLVARLAGLAALAVALGFAVRVWIVPEYDSYGPPIGFVATVLGGLIAAFGDPVTRSTRWRA
jgi:hypothetical protein